jgi:PIN domain nuclease of toxin-antitoxin system
VRLLLDTHALIWAATDPERLSERAAAAISDPDNDVYVSAVSGWEVAIKRARGRLRFPDVDRRLLAAMQLSELPVTLAHASEVGGLPGHHRDPFDRMLVAQARSDQLTIVSQDRALAAYDVALHW